MSDNAEKRLSVVANAIGFEMLRHDGRPVRKIQGTDGIEVTGEEAARCRAAAERVLERVPTAIRAIRPHGFLCPGVRRRHRLGHLVDERFACAGTATGTCGTEQPTNEERNIK